MKPVLMLWCILCLPGFVEAPGGMAVAVHGRLQVCGNHFVDQRGDVVSFAGPSLFWGNKGWMERAE